jgi:hypothetical protein
MLPCSRCYIFVADRNSEYFSTVRIFHKWCQDLDTYETTDFQG